MSINAVEWDAAQSRRAPHLLSSDTLWLKEAIMKLNFEWDEEKAKANLKKHKVSFDEATTVFSNPLSITILDPDHSVGEQRYVDIGRSDKGRVLVVVYTERGANIRIISCRKATPTERRHYEEGND